MRNGLFLRGVSRYVDRIEFEVFASRPFRMDHLGTLNLSDDLGTKYEFVPPETGEIDGQATIAFKPAVPAGWSQLQLNQPGWGLFIANVDLPD
jgi:hypothetical protein